MQFDLYLKIKNNPEIFKANRGRRPKSTNPPKQ